MDCDISRAATLAPVRQVLGAGLKRSELGLVFLYQRVVPIEHAGSGRLIFPTHFPTPTGGTIASDGAEYYFVFDGEGYSAMRG